MSVEISSDNFVSVNIGNIMLLPAERRWSFPVIFYICKMSMEISIDVFFSIYLKISMIFAFAIKTSVKLFIDI